MKLGATSALAIAFAITSACGNHRAEHPEPHRTSTPPASIANPEPTAPTAPASILASDVSAFVAAWAAAQNSGDFDRYAALYATRFSGVKRTLDRTTSFDREGWMRDRRRMFGQAMRVAIRDVVIETTPTAASVSFTQRWASGTYSDEGAKRLTLVREEGRLKIATEEMLASVRLGELDSALEVGLFVAFPARGGAVAALAPAAASEATGAARLASTDEPLVVLKDAGPGVPSALTALVGREVSVIERSRSCVGRIASVAIARLVIPHFGTVQGWEGEDFDDSTPPVVATPAARARDAWSMGTYTYYAAQITSDCDHPVGMTLEPNAGVSMFVPREPSVAERASIRRAFEHTPRFATLEREYAAFLAEGESDDEHPAVPAQRDTWARAAATVVFTHDARTVATVVHNSEGCGGFGGSAWASFELGAGAPVEHRLSGSIGDYVSVISVFDHDGDGTLEAIVRQGAGSYAVIRLTPTPSRIRAVEVDYLDCPC